MRRQQQHLRQALACAAILTLGLGILLAPAPSSQADDRDLLRENTSKPYLFILLDTSASMSLAIDGSWLEAGADDPRSRLYLAKEALYDVFSTVSSVQFGFATFNQDNVRATSKHWLYYVRDNSDNNTKLASFPIDYPAIEPGGEVEVSVAPPPGSSDPPAREVQIDGDMMTFGKSFGVPGGTCAAPLALPRLNQLNNAARVEERRMVNRYSKLGSAGTSTTVMWVRQSNKTYRMTWERDGGDFADYSNDLKVKITLEEVSSCSPVTVVQTWSEDDIKLDVWTDFLMADSSTDMQVISSAAGISEEDLGGVGWDFIDVEGSYACGTGKPFSGGGWEGNYDTGSPYDTNGLDNVSEASGGTVDTYCKTSSSSASVCTNDLHTWPTQPDATFPALREFDSGDMLPLHWATDNKAEFLQRLNPFHDLNVRNRFSFSQAFFFENQANSSTGTLRPRSFGFGSARRQPIIAAGNSPFAFAMNDFRCWYRGGPADNKCKNPNNSETFTQGFENLANSLDPDWQCRRPYFIVITDSEDNCPGNAPTAVIANLNSKSAIQTWALNVGTGNLNNIVQPGKGEEIKVESRDELRDELRDILGTILEEARSFASAAVPSVQADVEDKIYLTQFTPLQGVSPPSGEPGLFLSSLWPGRADSFLKPLPINATAVPPVPDIRPVANCKNPDPANPRQAACHLWNAGEEILNQAPTWDDINAARVTESIGPTRDTLRAGFEGSGQPENYRRILYSMAADGSRVPKGHVPRPRKLFYHSPPDVQDLVDAGVDSQTALNDAREDLWSGLGLYAETFQLGASTDASVWTQASNPTNGDISLLMETFRRTYSWKRAIIGANDETKIDYVLGDIFHSNPQIVGGPQNARYLADPDSFPLYDTYFEIQRRRRKVLLLGSNDGMLHAFDAGVYEEDDPSANEPLTGDFNNGTGREVWSYIPRIQLPVVQMRMASQDHLWGVDGTPTVGDVFIDTKHDGGPFGSERSWRTVAVSGMRRGGRTVFALDVTKPDQMARVQQTAGLGGIEEGWVPTQNDSMPGCMGRDDGTISTPAPGGKVVIPPPTDPANPNEFGNENGQCAWDASTDTQNPALRYPIPLWEFSDDSDWEWNAVTGQHDGNGRLDLGHTWSTPNIGAIMVRDNIDGEDNQGDFPCPDDATLRCQKIFVAIFGGGMDPNGAMNGGAGNWLYMVDVETGKMIYKRELTDGIDVSPGAPDGSAPGGPAAVDTDQDGFLDRVYIGTTEGLIFRVDMTVIPELARPCDDITDPLAIGVQSVCIQDTTWDPKVLFDTVTLETDPFSGGTVASRRPIFFPPAVIFSAELGRYALAFGTGNRNQLWSRAPLGGNRFYVFIDDSDFLISTGPLTEADLVDVSNAQTDPTGRDLLQDRSNGERGWFLRLGEPSPTDPPVTAIPNFTPADETVITSGTAIAGLVSFSSFLPVVQASGGSGNSLATCARTGTSRNYVMLIDNGDAILENCDDTGTCEQRRDESVGTLVSEPFVEQDQTQNPCEGPDCGTTRPPCAGTDAISDVLKERIYPPNCKFGNYRFNLSTMRADTGVECIAQIPVCIIEKNWKEF